MRIYIAAPYCPQNCSLHDAARIAQHNVDRVIEVANRLIELGHQPFVPHLSHYIHTHYSCKHDYGDLWYEYDLTFLRLWAEAILYLSPSRGADLELEEAKKIGLRIFYSVDEILIEKGEEKKDERG